MHILLKDNKVIDWLNICLLNRTHRIFNVICYLHSDTGRQSHRPSVLKNSIPSRQSMIVRASPCTQYLDRSWGYGSYGQSADNQNYIITSKFCRLEFYLMFFFILLDTSYTHTHIQALTFIQKRSRYGINTSRYTKCILKKNTPIYKSIIHISNIKLYKNVLRF